MYQYASFYVCNCFVLNLYLLLQCYYSVIDFDWNKYYTWLIISLIRPISAVKNQGHVKKAWFYTSVQYVNKIETNNFEI